MRHNSHKFLKPTEHLRTLQVLEEVSKDSAISQRKLSSRLGVALGVTNACIKKMISKGYISANGINHKKMSYSLTAQGVTEKAKLTYRFLRHTVGYYINLKKKINLELDIIYKAGLKRILYYGAGEVMEVAFICLNGTDFEMVGIVDDSKERQGERVFNFTIMDPGQIKSMKPEAILITSIRYKSEISDKLKKNKGLKDIALYSL